jgi:hypothetical protein
MFTLVPTLHDADLSDITLPLNTISQKQAEQLFLFFKHHPLFNWNDANNGCEGRADAVCVLLDQWNVPNYKGWVFSGSYLKNHVGELKQNWKYHVAPVLTVRKDDHVLHYVLDPATAGYLQPIADWAAAITHLPHSYYFIRNAHWYIFPGNNFSTSKWHRRNRQNRKWMIQCLAGINGLTATGKARLCFNKTRLKNTFSAFQKAMKDKPELIDAWHI